MNIETKLVTEKELIRINFLRETSLINFYRTGVKSLYSFLCHNVKNSLWSTWGSASWCKTDPMSQSSWRIRTFWAWWRKGPVSPVSQTSSIRWTNLACAITASSSIKNTSSFPANSPQTNKPSPKWDQTATQTPTSQKPSKKDLIATALLNVSWLGKKTAWRVMPKFVLKP